jgi:adenylate kinase family enzyme
VQRVLVVGSGGAGKSTLARQLGKVLDIEVVHLDALFWQPGWVMAPRDQELGILARILARDTWIIDGNYGGTLSHRLPRADTVIFLDFPRWLCLWRAAKRAVTYWGRTRPDMAPGCPERLDWEFVRWIWSFPSVHRPRLLRQLTEAPGERQLIRLRSPREAQELVADLREQQAVLGDHREPPQSAMQQGIDHLNRALSEGE